MAKDSKRINMKLNLLQVLCVDEYTQGYPVSTVVIGFLGFYRGTDLKI